MVMEDYTAKLEDENEQLRKLIVDERNAFGEKIDKLNEVFADIEQNPLRTLGLFAVRERLAFLKSDNQDGKKTFPFGPCDKAIHMNMGRSSGNTTLAVDIGQSFDRSILIFNSETTSHYIVKQHSKRVGKDINYSCLNKFVNGKILADSYDLYVFDNCNISGSSRSVRQMIEMVAKSYRGDYLFPLFVFLGTPMI